MKKLRRVLLVLLLILGLLGLAAAAVAVLLTRHPSLEPYADQAWNRPPPAAGALQVRFLGVTTVLVTDGQTALLTDGFFSRPGKLRAMLGHVAPDEAAIERGLREAGIGPGGTPLAAIITVHSHYDHAMDAGVVARLTGARLVGSPSTAQVGRGAGLPEARILVTERNQPLRFGRFTVTLLPSRHAPTGFTGGTIDAPLQPPARATDYKEDRSDAILIEHDDGTRRRSLLVVGSAGFVPGALRGVHADVVMLGIGLLGRQDDDYIQSYWNEVVRATGARLVLPIHWDDFTLPLDDLRPMPTLLDDFERSMRFLNEQARRDGVALRLPRIRTPMDIWAAAPADAPR